MSTNEITYRPSSSDQWVPCEANVVLYRHSGEDDDTEWSVDGTNGHTLFEACLKEGKDAQEFVGEELFELHPDFPDIPTTVSQEMADDLQPVLDYVSDRFFHGVDDETPILWSELQVSVHPECGGTLDCALYWKEAQLLEAIDLKWGKGYMVEADTNQLKIYTAALVKAKKLRVKRSIQTVAQPRGYHSDGPVRTSEMTGTDLLLYTENLLGLLDNRVKRAENEMEPAFMIGDHCRWCDGKDDCPERQKTAMSHARHAEEIEVPGAGFTEEMEFLIEFGDLITDKINLARARLTDQILRGGKGHGYKCIEGRANRKLDFDDDKSALEFFRTKLKMKLMDCTTPKLNGIPALEKSIKKLYPKKEAEFRKHITKPQGSPKLVSEDHAGKPYQKRVDAMFGDESDTTNFL